MRAYFLSLKPQTPCNDYWDYGMMTDLIKGKLWRPSGFPDIDIVECSELPKDDTAIVVIPARHHADMVTEINNQINRINHVVLFLMGDEEAEFPVEKISHPSIRIWVQNPHPGRHDSYRKLGTGYPGQIHNYIGEYDKDVDIFFAGQITHQRRAELVESTQGMTNIRLIPTKGFTQGVGHSEYYEYMQRAKIAPAPSGAVIPDSFRLFEALECGALVIADERTPNGEVVHYWDWLFEAPTPFPHVTNWDRLPTLSKEMLEDYPDNLHKQTAWWIKYKRQLSYWLLEDLHG